MNGVSPISFVGPHASSRPRAAISSSYLSGGLRPGGSERIGGTPGNLAKEVPKEVQVPQEVPPTLRWWGSGGERVLRRSPVRSDRGRGAADGGLPGSWRQTGPREKRLAFGLLPRRGWSLRSPDRFPPLLPRGRCDRHRWGGGVRRARASARRRGSLAGRRRGESRP